MKWEAFYVGFGVGTGNERRPKASTFEKPPSLSLLPRTKCDKKRYCVQWPMAHEQGGSKYYQGLRLWLMMGSLFNNCDMHHVTWLKENGLWLKKSEYFLFVPGIWFILYICWPMTLLPFRCILCFLFEYSKDPHISMLFDICVPHHRKCIS